LAYADAKSPLALASAAIGVSTLTLSITALLLTASRAGLLVALAGLLLLFALLWHTSLTRARPKLLALGAPLLVAALVAIGAGFALERLGGLDAAASQRAQLLEIHWRFFEARPLTGHGLNTFHELHASALNGDNFRDQRAMGSAHNIYVQALEETGLIGFGLWVLALGAVSIKLLVLAIGRRPGADWASAALASLFIVLAHGTVDFGLQLPAIAAWLAFVLGAFSRASPA
jgi:O-antigen ligase